MTRGSPNRAYDLSTGTPLGQVRRFVSSWLGILLLVLNVVGVGALPPRSAEDGPAPFVEDIFGDGIVICTAGGMVVLDRNGVPSPAKDGGGHGDVCPFCLPLMHGGAETPCSLAVVALPMALNAPPVLPSRPAFARPSRLTGAAAPRAPPFA